MLNKLKQPSTWAGLAGLFGLIGQFFPQYAMYAHALTAGASGVAVAMNETGAA